MKICVFVLNFLSVQALSSEEIKEKVGSGCRNSASFSSNFMDKNGAICNACSFCEGTTLSSIFNPSHSSFCIDCGSSTNQCNQFQLITTFETSWRMWFVTIQSSDASIEDDPKQIILSGSNDFDGKVGTWTSLYNSDEYSGPIFSGRSEGKSMIFKNDKSYKYYSITLSRKESSSKIQVGNYGLIQAYAKECTSELHKKLTGISIPAELTSAPTYSPTTSNPTSSPTTAAPTNRALNNDSIKEALRWWFGSPSDKNRARNTYGSIEVWNTRQVTNMDQLFYHKNPFNDDINGWDVSAVTSMDHMFYYTKPFNRDISGWNVGNVRNMNSMFRGANYFNQNLSPWDVTKVTNMYKMFEAARIRHTLCWDVSGKNTAYMFSEWGGKTVWPCP